MLPDLLPVLLVVELLLAAGGLAICLFFSSIYYISIRFCHKLISFLSSTERVNKNKRKHTQTLSPSQGEMMSKRLGRTLVVRIKTLNGVGRISQC